MNEDSKGVVLALRARLAALQAVQRRPEGTEGPAVATALEAVLTAATAEARYLLDRLPRARRRGTRRRLSRVLPWARTEMGD